MDHNLNLKQAVGSFVVGIIFSIGLYISEMVQPQKVIQFLDVFGNWNPALMFVMIGAIGVHFFTYRIIRKRNLPIFANEWRVPIHSKISKSLVIGSFIFGVGWALGGFCPGPALVSLASFSKEPLIFVLSMFSGMFIFRLGSKKPPSNAA